MDEKHLEQRLCEGLRGMVRNPPGAATLTFIRSTSSAATLGDLLGGIEFDLIEDDSRWNPAPQLMQDIAGNMTPDIVIRSRRSGENRIYVEVKHTRHLSYGRADSQVVRYLLHLLGTTRQNTGAEDIQRAVVLAAPSAWFANANNADTWGFFLDTYGPLATAFGVTLAELHLTDESSNPFMNNAVEPRY